MLTRDIDDRLGAGRPAPKLDTLSPKWSALPPIEAVGRPSAGKGVVAIPTSVGPMTVAAVAPGVYRLRLGEATPPDYGILVRDPAAIDAAIRIGDDEVEIGTDRSTLTIQLAPIKFTLTRGEEAIFGSTRDGHFTRPHRLPPFARLDDGWFAAFGLDSGEAVYGLGEKWGPLNRRGQLVVSKAVDSLGVNEEISYKNCPFAWSPDGWGVFVHTPGQVTHGVGFAQWSHRAYGVAVEDSVLDLFIIAGADPAEVIGRYTDLTGRTTIPPLWSLGVWLSKAYYKDADELLATARAVRERGVPCDVIVLDGRAWLDTRTRFAFEFDPARYPDPKAVTDQIHALDLKLCCWEYPLISVHHPLFDELAERGWLLRHRDTGQPYRFSWDPEPFGTVLTPLPDSGLIDLTHPDAYAYWRDRHNDLFDLGVDVIKSDFGEQVPDEAIAANGDDGRRLHSVYPLLYNRCVFEATEARTPGEGLVFGRSGWAGSQRYPMQWGGDPQSDWEGLAASLRGGLSWGLSGVPCYATDIGGFYGAQPDAELFVRWTQAAVFSSHMRFHGIGPREPWAFGEEAETIVRAFIDLRYRLLPYTQGMLAEARDTGLPCMRAMALAFPDDPAAWAFDNQFMFGPDLMVVPVLQPGGRVRCYLPPGSWHDFWTGEVIGGGRAIEMVAPLDRLPLYGRSGGVLPLGPVVAHTGELAGRDRVDALKLFGRPDRAPCLADDAIGFEDRGGQGVALTGVPAAVEVRGSADFQIRRRADVVEIV